MDDSGEGRRFNAFAAPHDNHNAPPDGLGLGTAIMLHLGTQLRAYFDRLAPDPAPRHRRSRSGYNSGYGVSPASPRVFMRARSLSG